MENTPEAPVTPEVKSEATPTNTEQAAPAAQPDMHGFTSEQLADMQRFFQANGGYEKVKSKISNPTPAPAEEQKPAETVQPAPAAAPKTMPKGAVSLNEAMIRVYFKDLATKPEYAAIKDDIVYGKALEEMLDLGMNPFIDENTIDEDHVIKYLNLKAQTVPAKQSAMEPEASSAPTVDYVPVGEQINNMDEAYAVLRQDSQLKRMGKAGHPAIAKAEEYIKAHLNKPEK